MVARSDPPRVGPFRTGLVVTTIGRWFSAAHGGYVGQGLEDGPGRLIGSTGTQILGVFLVLAGAVRHRRTAVRSFAVPDTPYAARAATASRRRAPEPPDASLRDLTPRAHRRRSTASGVSGPRRPAARARPRAGGRAGAADDGQTPVDAAKPITRRCLHAP
jgi:hypothetical protein